MKENNDNQQPPLSKSDNKVGRPKTVYSDDTVAEIDRLALLNCKDRTIAEALGIPVQSFKQRFSTRTIKKRGQFRIKLREAQSAMLDKTPAMAIFLGKNDLGQTDKIDTKITGDCKVIITK